MARCTARCSLATSVVLLLGLLGCGSSPLTPPGNQADTTRAFAEIAVGFDFIPPLHVNKVGVGTNNPDASPRVEIWTGEQANRGVLVATFERPAVELVEGWFQVNWDTNGEVNGLPPGTESCVIQVWSGFCLLGYVDCQIDRTNGQGKKAADPEYFGLKDGRTLPIKFIVDTTVPLPAPVTVAVTPAAVTLDPGASQAFDAQVANATDASVTWSVTEASGGSITSAGVYTAPAAAGVYHVVATSNADPTVSATAEVTVRSPDVPVIFGGLGTADGKFSGHIFLDAGPNDEIYACDSSANPRIQVFSSDGQFLRKWDGSAPGILNRFGGLMGIDVYGATPETAEVYAVDALLGVDEIRVYSSTGAFRRRFGGSGSGLGQLRMPYDVAVSPDGQRVYVADSENYRVQCFSAAGQPLFAWGSRGAGNGQFGRTEAVQVDSQGNVYVSDGQLHGQNNHRIQKFDANGNWLATFGGPATLNEPMGIAIWGDFLHVADFRNYQMETLNKDTGAPAGLGVWAQGPGSAIGQVDKPFDVTVDSRGNLYVGESYEFGTGNARIQKFVGVN